MIKALLLTLLLIASCQKPGKTQEVTLPPERVGPRVNRLHDLALAQRVWIRITGICVDYEGHPWVNTMTEFTTESGGGSPSNPFCLQVTKFADGYRIADHCPPDVIEREECDLYHDDGQVVRWQRDDEVGMQ